MYILYMGDEFKDLMLVVLNETCHLACLMQSIKIETQLQCTT